MFWGFLWIICVYLFSLYQSFCLPNEHRMEWNPTITRSHVLGVSLVFDFAPFCCFLFSKCQKCSAVEFKLSFSVCHEAISVAFWCLSGILICDLFFCNTVNMFYLLVSFSQPFGRVRNTFILHSHGDEVNCTYVIGLYCQFIANLISC